MISHAMCGQACDTHPCPMAREGLLLQGLSEAPWWKDLENRGVRRTFQSRRVEEQSVTAGGTEEAFGEPKKTNFTRMETLRE